MWSYPGNMLGHTQGTIEFSLAHPARSDTSRRRHRRGRLSRATYCGVAGPYECLNVILSHYHMDHAGCLSYLAGTWTRGTVRIYAPGHPFVDVDPEETLNKLLSPPLFALTLAEFPARMEVVPVTAARLRIGDLTIALRAQNHPGGSMGVRIDDTVAYVTDTPVDEATAEFVQGTRLLLHEAWLTDLEAERDEAERARHSSCSGVAHIARRGAVGELVSSRSQYCQQISCE